MPKSESRFICFLSKVDETVKNLSLTLTSAHQIKLNGLPFISTTRLYKAKLPAYTSPQIASEQAFHSYMTPPCLDSQGSLGRTAFRRLINEDLVRARSYFFAKRPMHN
jgi:hypothetical protein